MFRHLVYYQRIFSLVPDVSQYLSWVRHVFTFESSNIGLPLMDWKLCIS